MRVAQPATVCAPASLETLTSATLGEARRVVDRGDGDGEGLRRRGVDAAVGGAAVVVDLHRDRGGAEGVRRRREGQRARRRRPPAARRRARCCCCVTVKLSVWPTRRPGPAQMAVAQPATVCAPESSSTVWSRALGEARRVVDGGDGDREGLRALSVDAAVGGAAVVVRLHGDRGGAVGVRRRRVGQRAARRRPPAAPRRARCCCCVTMKFTRLRRLVAGPALIAVAQPVTRLRAGVLEHRLVGALGEARRVVDRGDGDGERLRRAGVDAAVGGAAVVVRS